MAQDRKTVRPTFLLALAALPLATAVGLIFILVGLPKYHSPWYIKGEQPSHRSKKQQTIAPAMNTAARSDDESSAEEALIPQSPASVQLGANEYRNNCVSCHGPDGRAVASKLSVAPEDLNSWAVQWRQDEDLYRAISYHQSDTSPLFKDRYTREELWGIVHYIREMFLPEGSPPWHSLKGQSQGKIGRAIYKSLRCGRCHGTDAPRELAGFPPTLDYAGSKLNRDWVVKYLLNPFPIRWKLQGVRPAKWMPAFQLEKWEAEALGSYLTMQADTVRFPEVELKNQGSVDEGRNLFQSYQCLGCHTLRGKGNQIGPELTSVGARLKPAYMFQFVKDPQGIIPGTAMKDFEMWDSEASSLVLYLETLK